VKRARAAQLQEPRVPRHDVVLSLGDPDAISVAQAKPLADFTLAVLDRLKAAG
jgi:hypothetical protein